MTEYLFWGAIGLLCYTFAGYPLFIFLLARYSPRPLRSGKYEPRVAIVIVGHNEYSRVAAKIETCLAQDYPPDRCRVLFVSDGSTDGTDEAVRSLSSDRVSLLSFSQRRGKAACLNDAVASCDEEIVVFTDARQRLNPQAVRWLTEALFDRDVGAVSGELMFVADPDDTNSFAQGVDAYWRYEKLIRRSEALVHSVPGATGALYALRRELFVPIPPVTILDDVAIPMQAVLQGHRVAFEGRAQAYDRPSSSVQQERTRKVRTSAGNFQLLWLYPQLLLPWRNPIFVQFLSHKVLRLLAPWGMAAALATNVLLAGRGPMYGALLAVQVAGYCAPVVGALVPASRRWLPVKLAIAFLALNWFAVLGLLQFACGRDAHLWQPSVARRTGRAAP
jgi:poly-beta-1,6-N-acetyl-D-glucosamine synthase